MIKLERSVQAWGTAGFEEIFKRELARQAAALPLQQAMTGGNYVSEAPLGVMINHIDDSGAGLCVSAGIFFRSVIGGCSCADDPSPASDIEEYCEIMLEIDRHTGEAQFHLQ